MRSFAIVVLAVALGACESEVESAGATCEPVAACGGDILGTWQLRAVCSDDLVALARSAVFAPECVETIVGVEADAAGTTTYGADGTMTWSRTIMLDVQMALTSACLTALNGQVVDAASACSMLASDAGAVPSLMLSSCSAAGETCDCTAKVEVTMSNTSAYAISGTQIMADSEAYDYCVAGDVLTVIERRVDAELAFKLER